jgi:hypothetical protein
MIREDGNAFASFWFASRGNRENSPKICLDYNILFASISTYSPGISLIAPLLARQCPYIARAKCRADTKQKRASTMKTVYRGLAMAATAIALTACAASPEDIKAHPISTAQYSYLSCPQLAEYKATLTAAYNKAADSENSARTEDAATSLLLGFPVGSMTHESVPWQVGDLKGRIIAVSQVQAANKCSQQREATAEQ